MGEDATDFLAREHGGRAATGVAECRLFQFEFRDAEDLPGEKDHGIEGLFLG